MMDNNEPAEPIELHDIRKEIDSLDKQLLDLIAIRCDLAVSTLDVKKRHGLSSTDTRREGEVKRRSAMLAQERGLDVELVHAIFGHVIGLARVALQTSNPEPKS